MPAIEALDPTEPGAAAPVDCLAAAEPVAVPLPDADADDDAALPEAFVAMVEPVCEGP
jgi:hypothetical protein